MKLRSRHTDADFVGDAADVAEISRCSLYGAFCRIEQSPDSFPRMHGAPLVRHARFGRYPYRIVYLVASTGALHVLAIPHDRRRPLYWKGRARRFT